MNFRFQARGPQPPSKFPKLVRRILDTIERLPDGLFVDSWDLCDKLEVSKHSLDRYGIFIPKTHCIIRGSNKKYYANPATIAAWKKENEVPRPAKAKA
jgi:hypothetical protein